MALRKSPAERYAALEARGAALEGRPVLHLGPLATPIHVELVGVLTDMLDMAVLFSDSSVPVYLRTMVRTLRKIQPTLIAELANVPPEAIREFLTDVIAKMQRVVDAPSVAEGRPAIGSGTGPLPIENTSRVADAAS